MVQVVAMVRLYLMPLVCAGTLTWYTQASGGTAIGTGSPFTTPFLTATTNFYVSCTINGCEGPRSLVVASIRPIDPGSIAANQFLCSGGDPAAFTVYQQVVRTIM
jgi:hypothetical protein